MRILLQLFVYASKAQCIVCRTRDLWHVEITLKHSIGVIIKDTRVLIVYKECFLAIFVVKNSSRVYKLLPFHDLIQHRQVMEHGDVVHQGVLGILNAI
jgi:hypothetical protein